MGRIKTDTLSQIARAGYQVKVICRCGNNKVFNPTLLSLNHNVRTMDELMRRFRCDLCKQRPWDVQVTFGEEF